MKTPGLPAWAHIGDCSSSAGNGDREDSPMKSISDSKQNGYFGSPNGAAQCCCSGEKLALCNVAGPSHSTKVGHQRSLPSGLGIHPQIPGTSEALFAHLGPTLVATGALGQQDPGRYWWLVKRKTTGVSTFRAIVNRRKRRRMEGPEAPLPPVVDVFTLVASMVDAGVHKGRRLCKEQIIANRRIITDSALTAFICRTFVCNNLTQTEMDEILQGDYGIDRRQLIARGRGPGYACDLLCNLISRNDADTIYYFLLDMCDEGLIKLVMQVIHLIETYGWLL